MAINRRFLSTALLSLTLMTSGVAGASEVRANRFDDLYHEKLALLKAKKLKQEKHHFGARHHHFEPKHRVKKVHSKSFKKHRSFGRSRRKFVKSPFEKKFLFKK